VGLFKGGAILIVDGKQRMIKQGKTSPEGIKVIEATSKFVRFELDGEVKKLSLSKKISTRFEEASPKSEARLTRGNGGHYWTPGRINNRPCEFVVDTGATFVSMSSEHAAKLGLSYKNGTPVKMSTANGIKDSYKITLESVTVGTVTVNGVDAVVTDGKFPEVILLGNAYLNRIDMRIDAGVMVLQSKI